MLKIGGINKLTLLDFPNEIAAIIFLVGCNFLCPFCHNKSLVLNDEKLEFIRENEIIEFLESRKNKLDGIVISGGEPLLQFNDLVPFIKKIKDMGFKVKLDTNGSYYDELNYLIKNRLVDYVAIDIKNSFNKYLTTIGLKENEATKKYLENINKSILFLLNEANKYNIDYEFRTTVIKEFLDKDDFINIANLIKGVKSYYLQQFEDIGTNIKEGFTAYNKNKLNEFKELLIEKDINTSIRGI